MSTTLTIPTIPTKFDAKTIYDSINNNNYIDYYSRITKEEPRVLPTQPIQPIQPHDNNECKKSKKRNGLLLKLGKINVAAVEAVKAEEEEEKEEEDRDKSTEYYYKHRDQKLEYQKNYNRQKGDSIKEYNKSYYMKRREEILEKAKTKITCECGCEVQLFNMNSHKKTKKHLRMLALRIGQ